ncbi:hypothetical protein TWF225_000810 [Orbilia oligospora]|nr:hypothetical protein TWF225_000810 [Orbilia oligospora]KAF3241070.1 hypothetical protein TWF217_000630 [Orbilia oligospora]KAF3277170.1 hypothetical protein TWF132_001758 [Orbilia oligospora]
MARSININCSASQCKDGIREIKGEVDNLQPISLQSNKTTTVSHFLALDRSPLYHQYFVSFRCLILYSAP